VEWLNRPLISPFYGNGNGISMLWDHPSPLKKQQHIKDAKNPISYTITAPQDHMVMHNATSILTLSKRYPILKEGKLEKIQNSRNT
jgi:hypothetical protein